MIVVAHYYPVYIKSNGKPAGWWARPYSQFGGDYKAAPMRFEPLIGRYDVRDKETVKWQVREAFKHSIDAFVVSLWYSVIQGNWEKDALEGFISSFEALRSEGDYYASEFYLAFMIEGHNRTDTEVQEMIDYVWDNYASKDWYLKDPDTGDPLLVIYRPEGKVTITNPGFTVYWCASGASDDEKWPYGGRITATRQQRNYTYSSGVMTMIFDYITRTSFRYTNAPNTVLNPLNIKQILRDLMAAYAINPKYLAIISWNEYFETPIEPTKQFGRLYLNLIARVLGYRSYE